MSRHLARIFGIFLTAFCASGIAYSADLIAGLHVGYKGGASIGASGIVSDFAQGFPLSLEFGLTYSSLNPGDPVRARRIFIANATNGTPEKAGHAWDFKMEFLYNLRLSGPKASYVYAGTRYSLFTGNFQYIGANEEFDVTSTQWGLSVGTRWLFSMSRKMNFMLSAGVVGYFPGSLHGHDTTYNPDDLNVNPQEDFKYEDAAAAISTPKFQPEFMIGLAYSL